MSNTDIVALTKQMKEKGYDRQFRLIDGQIKPTFVYVGKKKMEERQSAASSQKASQAISDKSKTVAKPKIVSIQKPLPVTKTNVAGTLSAEKEKFTEKRVDIIKEGDDGLFYNDVYVNDKLLYTTALAPNEVESFKKRTKDENILQKEALFAKFNNDDDVEEIYINLSHNSKMADKDVEAWIKGSDSQEYLERTEFARNGFSDESIYDSTNNSFCDTYTGAANHDFDEIMSYYHNKDMYKIFRKQFFLAPLMMLINEIKMDIVNYFNKKQFKLNLNHSILAPFTLPWYALKVCIMYLLYTISGVVAWIASFPYRFVRKMIEPYKSDYLPQVNLMGAVDEYLNNTYKAVSVMAYLLFSVIFVPLCIFCKPVVPFLQSLDPLHEIAVTHIITPYLNFVTSGFESAGAFALAYMSIPLVLFGYLLNINTILFAAWFIGIVADYAVNIIYKPLFSEEFLDVLNFYVDQSIIHSNSTYIHKRAYLFGRDGFDTYLMNGIVGLVLTFICMFVPVIRTMLAEWARDVYDVKIARKKNSVARELKLQGVI